MAGGTGGSWVPLPGLASSLQETRVLKGRGQENDKQKGDTAEASQLLCSGGKFDAVSSMNIGIVWSDKLNVNT